MEIIFNTMDNTSCIASNINDKIILREEQASWFIAITIYCMGTVCNIFNNWSIYFKLSIKTLIFFNGDCREIEEFRTDSLKLENIII